MQELNDIMVKFADSGWDLISTPAQKWLNGENNKESLIAALHQANEECGTCGCELDPLYKKALSLLED